MAEKIALQGLSRIKFFPVTANDTTAYTVGTGFDLPNVQEMSQDADTSESKIYADDVIYLNMKAWNGLNTTITLAEMTLDMMAKLGFGTVDTTSSELKWNPQGENKEFAVSFCCLMANGKYRMYKMYSFTVNEVKESGKKTKGGGNDINTYQIIGTFTARKKDMLPGVVKDSASETDIAWLDTVE